MLSNLVFFLLLMLVGSVQADLVPTTALATADTFPTWADFDQKRLKGKVVLLNFWATYCGPCKVEIPDLAQLHDSFANQPFALVGVSVDRGQPAQLQRLLKKFADRYKINYPIVLDPDYALANSYGGIIGLPTTLLIDRSGQVHKTYIGARSYARFAEDVRSLLDSPPPAKILPDKP
jgi:thiol-disulfide isomerase/thioredoxin